MTEKQERKHGIVINASFLVSLLVLVISSYAAYVVVTLERRMERQYQTQCQTTDKLNACDKRLEGHVKWHKGKGDSVE